jgi:hypothetical protein
MQAAPTFGFAKDLRQGADEGQEECEEDRDKLGQSNIIKKTVYEAPK